jgi:hypothetical protein
MGAGSACRTPLALPTRKIRALFERGGFLDALQFPVYNSSTGIISVVPSVFLRKGRNIQRGG